MPLAIAIDLDEQLRGVSRRRGVGVEQDVLVLGQVLGGRLLGSAGTVQQLPLQQREVGLENKHRAGLQQLFQKVWLSLIAQSSNTCDP